MVANIPDCELVSTGDEERDSAVLGFVPDGLDGDEDEDEHGTLPCENMNFISNVFIARFTAFKTETRVNAAMLHEKTRRKGGLDTQNSVQRLFLPHNFYSALLIMQLQRASFGTESRMSTHLF
jgi:hypothetical protein